MKRPRNEKELLHVAEMIKVRSLKLVTNLLRSKEERRRLRNQILVSVEKCDFSGHFMIFAFRVNDMGTRVYLQLIFNNWFFAKLKIVREE